MIKTIRSQSPVLLTILFVLISASLLVFYNMPQRDQFAHGRLGKIDGIEVTPDQFKLAQQAFREGTLYKYGKDVSDSQSRCEKSKLSFASVLFDFKGDTQ